MDGDFLSYLYFTGVFPFFRCFILPLHYMYQVNIVRFTLSYGDFADYMLHSIRAKVVHS